MALCLSGHQFSLHKIQAHTQSVYHCSVCEYSTDRMARLREHLNTHSKDQPFQCSQCSKRFSTHYALSVHTKSAHTAERLHCEYCDFKSVTNTKMRDHVRNMHTHKGVKPFKCGYCDFHSASSGNCRKHCMRLHSDKPVKWVKDGDFGAPVKEGELKNDKLAEESVKSVSEVNLGRKKTITTVTTQESKQMFSDQSAQYNQSMLYSNPSQNVNTYPSTVWHPVCSAPQIQETIEPYGSRNTDRVYTLVNMGTPQKVEYHNPVKHLENIKFTPVATKSDNLTPVLYSDSQIMKGVGDKYSQSSHVKVSPHADGYVRHDLTSSNSDGAHRNMVSMVDVNNILYLPEEEYSQQLVVVAEGETAT